MEGSQSVPSSLHASVKTILPIRNSASVQSHLSASSSQQRIRNPNHLPASKKDVSPELDDIEANYTQSWSPILVVSSLHTWFPPELQTGFRRLTLRRWLRWLIILYSLLSAIYLSMGMLHLLPQKLYLSSWTSRLKVTRMSNMSLLETLPTDYLLSKLTSIYPQPKAFIPHVLRADAQIDTVTACLWTSDADLDLLPAWIAKWPGLVSLLVTTSATTPSSEFDKLLQKLSYFRHQFPRNASLSLHLLQIDSRTTDSPNTYLNLARLLSETLRVVLFPGNLSNIPPKALYRSYFSGASSSAKNTSHRPMIFTSRGHTNYPFSALSPIVMNRDDPLWCTERFFPSVSREMDWGECMWQVWLEHFGDIDIKQTTEWVRGFPTAPDPTSMATKLRRRLSGKYRSETCMLAMRQLAALKTPDRRGADAKKSRWLKRNCREWMTLA